MLVAVAEKWLENPGPSIIVAQPWPAGCADVGNDMPDDAEDLVGVESADLIKAIAARQDKAAFAELFDRYAGKIKAWLMRSGATAEAAEDLAQETLLTVWRKASYYDAGRAGASAWIYTIARNARIDRIRRDQRAAQHAKHEYVESEGPARPDGILEGAEREKRVREALEGLNAEQVRVVKLSFFEGRPHGEIAEQLEIPLGTVKSRLRLAMNRLRESLGDLT